MGPLVNAVQALHEICVKKGTAYEPYVLEVHQAASSCIKLHHTIILHHVTIRDSRFCVKFWHEIALSQGGDHNNLEMQADMNDMTDRSIATWITWCRRGSFCPCRLRLITFELQAGDAFLVRISQHWHDTFWSGALRTAAYFCACRNMMTWFDMMYNVG